MMALTLDIIARTMFSADVSGEVESGGGASLEIRGHHASQHPRPASASRNGFRAASRPPMARAIASDPKPWSARIPRAAHATTAIDRCDLLSMLLAARDPRKTGTGMSDKQLRD